MGLGVFVPCRQVHLVSEARSALNGVILVPAFTFMQGLSLDSPVLPLMSLRFYPIAFFKGNVPQPTSEQKQEK
jgi:hypothetical protein